MTCDLPSPGQRAPRLDQNGRLVYGITNKDGSGYIYRVNGGLNTKSNVGGSHHYLLFHILKPRIMLDCSKGNRLPEIAINPCHTAATVAASEH
jgi:hypothetical protein